MYENNIFVLGHSAAYHRILARTGMNRPVTMALTETATTILELSASSIKVFLDTQGPDSLTVVDFYTTWCVGY